MTHDDINQWCIALVTFERRSPTNEFLPDACQGAVGWMGRLAADDATVRGDIEAALKAADLRLLEIARTQRPPSWEFVKDLDDHLASNMLKLEPGRCVAWGTIITYLADGEA